MLNQSIVKLFTKKKKTNKKLLEVNMSRLLAGVYAAAVVLNCTVVRVKN